VSKQRINLWLPFPPSVNHYWGTNGSHKFLTASARKFREKVVAAARQNVPFRKRLGISIVLIMPSRQERDIDNYNKGLFDALAHAGVIVSDKQFDKLSVQRGHVAKPGCCRVTIWEL